MKYLFSFGGGVNSTALLVWMWKNQPDIFYAMSILFADTGGELPETYTHLKAFEPWLEARNQKTIHVGRPDSLESYCLESKSSPMMK